MTFQGVSRSVFRAAVAGFATGVPIAILMTLIQVAMPDLNAQLNSLPWSKEVVLVVWPSSLLLLATGEGDWAVPMVAVVFNGIHYAAVFVFAAVSRWRCTASAVDRGGQP
jgi:hypothetical protein